MNPAPATASPPGTRLAAARMAQAASAWLDALDRPRRAAAAHPAPGTTAEADAERLRWYYTPTDHGGLPLSAQTPQQQGLAMRLVSEGLSDAGYATVATIIGLENVLDRVEGWSAGWGRERGRDPGLYWTRVFGEPGPVGTWGWRFAGHHLSLNVTVVDGEVVSTTPSFLGADPAASHLLGGALLRPLGAAEDLARRLVRSLSTAQSRLAVLHPRAVSDIVSGNRPRLLAHNEMIHMQDLWRGRFSEPALAERVDRIDRDAEARSGYTAADHRGVAITRDPAGIAARDLDDTQRGLLAALVGAVVADRVPDALSCLTPSRDGAGVDGVHLAWAGSTEAGEPHYFRMHGPRLLVEYNNTQRDANHAHSVWRDPVADFGAHRLPV